jgi:protein SCO1/2
LWFLGRGRPARVFVFSFFLSTLFAFAACSPPAELPVLGNVPEFELTERSARTVTRAELDGKVWIADFIFTKCSTSCPDMTGAMRRLQEKLPVEIRFVSFSVDPARDTPEVLTGYAAKNGADPDRWLFLTGDKSALYGLSKKGFKLAVDDQNGTPSEPVTHSSRFVLVDRNGQIRGYYGIEDADAMTRLTADASRLL